MANPATFNKNTQNVILPNKSFPTAASFVVPDTLSAGTYYIYVYANANRSVFEYPGTPQIARTGALVISRPDVTVPVINSPTNAVAGQPTVINYEVKNIGAGSIYNHLRKDRLFISSSSIFDGSAVQVATASYTESVGANASVPHSFTYSLPPSQSGTRYFFVQTNWDNSFLETNSGNNRSVSTQTNFAVAPPVDLLVTAITTPDTITTAFIRKIRYTVTNTGSGTATGSIRDSLFVSCSNSFNPATATYLQLFSNTVNLAPGESYTDSGNVTIPLTYLMNACYPNQDYNNAYLFVKTNSNAGIYEGANTTNNIGVSGLKVLDNPLVDHIVSRVSGSDSTIVGRQYYTSWTVKNLGRNPSSYYAGRNDSIYFSIDSVFNTNRKGAGHYGWGQSLNTNDTIALGKYVTVPNVPTGDYYLWVNDNVNDNIRAEVNLTNNQNLMRNPDGSARKIHITRNPLPDLVDSIVSAPSIVAVGQPFTVIRKISNIGAGEIYPTSFFMDYVLANDPQGTVVSYNMDSRQLIRPLLPGGSIYDTLQLIMPSSAQESVYSLVSRTDSRQYVVESNELNNNSAFYITAFRPDPVDLIVQNVSIPDTALLGYTLDTAKWVISNNSANTALGVTSDGLYLSSSASFDSTATLVGIKAKNINMPGLSLDTLSATPLVTGVTEGNYNLFVRTDLTNQILETNETNNTGQSLGQVYVKVKELQLDLLETNTLASTQRFYKLIIPDSLDGATFSVKLTSNDSLTRINQMFIGKGYIPTAANFDYTYPTANYGNQDIVMAYTTAGTYYIMIRAINPGAVIQNIKLLARKLPFEITNVQSSSGGNIGNVTVKISGSLFTPGMTARLNKAGTEITASAIYFTNSTVVYATFPLQGKPLGIYDITLSKADTSIATLANGFSVVPANNGGLITGGGNNTGGGNGNAPGCDPGAASGLNAQLVTELIVPAKVFRGWPFSISINFSNPTNYDIPAQVRTLYAEDIIKLGLTPQAVDLGNHSLTIEFTETNGPPGIIRAGGSGTITIHAKSNTDVPAHTYTQFSFR